MYVVFALCRSESLKTLVHYVALHTSTSHFKSIQTGTGTEETVHCFNCSRVFQAKTIVTIKAIVLELHKESFFFFFSLSFQIL